MQIAAILLTLGVIILVGLYLYAPFLERKSRLVTQEEHELSSLLAERDRAINSLQELDFDFNLGKIPEGEYPAQRAELLQKGADIMRQIDTYTSKADAAQDAESHLENAIAARRADGSSAETELSDDDIESMIINRKKSHREKSAGFCPSCGKPIMTSDRFCPSCGNTLS
jgi:rubrerythrin